MTHSNQARSGMSRAASFAQSAINVVDSCFTFGILDRAIVHLRLSLFSKGDSMLKKMKYWLLAIRPKTLTISLIPVLVGTAIAKSTGADIKYWLSISALLSAICIQIGMHFINDALDFIKGADTSERLGPLKVTQSGLLSIQQVYVAGLIVLGLTFLVGLPIIINGGLPIAILLIISVICGYCYTGGPAPLAYTGLSDLFVVLFYGFASIAAVYFLQTGNVDMKPFVAGAQIGCLSTVILVLNNLRDFKQDAKARKMTLVVRFGEQFSRWEITMLLFVPFMLSSMWVLLGYSWAAVLPWISLPIAIILVRKIWVITGRDINQYFALAALLHLTFGLLLSVSFWYS